MPRHKKPKQTQLRLLQPRKLRQSKRLLQLLHKSLQKRQQRQLPRRRLSRIWIQLILQSLPPKSWLLTTRLRQVLVGVAVGL